MSSHTHALKAPHSFQPPSADRAPVIAGRANYEAHICLRPDCTKYNSCIRSVSVSVQLTHNDIGPHNAAFYALQSRLERVRCVQNWRSYCGQSCVEHVQGQQGNGPITGHIHKLGACFASRSARTSVRLRGIIGTGEGFDRRPVGQVGRQRPGWLRRWLPWLILMSQGMFAPWLQTCADALLTGNILLLVRCLRSCGHAVSCQRVPCDCRCMSKQQ